MTTDQKNPIRNLVKVVDLGGPTARVVINEYYSAGGDSETWRHAQLTIMTPAATYENGHTPATSADVSLNEEATAALIAALLHPKTSREPCRHGDSSGHCERCLDSM